MKEIKEMKSNPVETLQLPHPNLLIDVLLYVQPNHFKILGDILDNIFNFENPIGYMFSLISCTES